MKTNLYQGQLVRLVVEDASRVAEKMAAWNRDSEYWRMLVMGPARNRSRKAVEKEIQDDLLNNPKIIFFAIRSLEDDRLLGEIDLEVNSWVHKDAFVGVGIGDAQDWDKGYGTDAMRLMLKFAFAELGLWRVSLTVFEYNRRAIRLYEKLGFFHEGSLKRALLREGRRWDMDFMGITFKEWERARLD